MARYYQTADREYLDDGIYMPPVELMSKVIAAKDAEIDQNLNNLNVIKDNVDTNIKYWDIDKDQAHALQQNWDNLVDNAVRNLMEHPLQNGAQQVIANLQRDWMRSLRQNGDTYNLQANLNAKNQSDADAAKIKDKVYGQFQNRLFEDMYRESRVDEYGNLVPLTEDNIFNYHNYGEYVENVNLFDTFSKRIKERAPHESQSTSFDNTRGISTTTGKVFRERSEIKKIMDEDIAKNLDPETYNKMKRDDELAKKYGYNGGKLWLNEDGTVNTEGELWKQQVKEQQDVYFKKDIKSTSSIFDHDLYNGYHGITKKNEDGTYTVSANFIPDSVIHQKALTKAYSNYVKDGGKLLTAKFGKENLIFSVRNGQVVYLSSSDGYKKATPVGSDLVMWYKIGEKMQVEREDPNSTAYSEIRNSDGTSDIKYLGDYYNDEVQMIKAPIQAFNQAVTNYNRGMEWSFAGSGIQSYNIGKIGGVDPLQDYQPSKTKFTNKTIVNRTAGDLRNAGADIPANIKDDAVVQSATPIKGEYYYSAYEDNGQTSSDFGELHLSVTFKDGDNTIKCGFPIDMPGNKYVEGNNATIGAE